jgi:hypothetical protein
METSLKVDSSSTAADFPHGLALLRDPLLNKGTAQQSDSLAKSSATFSSAHVAYLLAPMIAGALRSCLAIGHIRRS